MHKVVLINLAGRAYHLEEEGHRVLQTYLEEAGRRLASDPGKEEIMTDLERAIAEKCERLLSAHKNVITTAEIERIIGDMGPVENGSEHSAQSSRAASVSSATAPKRLYLIREGAMIAGVCTGLAAYFNVDVALIRVLFVGLTLLTGGGVVLLYLALMILVPYADTDEAYAAAHGEPFKAQDIVDRAKQRFEESYKRFTGGAYDKQQWRQWKYEMKQKKKAWKYAQKRRSSLLGVLIGALGLLWIFALLSLLTTHAIFGWAIPVGIPIWLALIFLFVLYQAFVGPIKAAQYGPYRYGSHTYVYSAWEGLIDGLTALFVLIALAWVYLYIPSVHALINNLPQEIVSAAQHVRSWFSH